MAVLRVIPAAGGEEWRVELRGGVVTVGRGLANVVVLRDDPRSSLCHATVTPTPAGYLLRDQGSTNGSWVNGIRVEERLLEDGDQVQLGGTVILFEG